MKTVKVVIFAVIGFVVMLLVLQNTAQMQAHFLWFTAGMPAIVLLFLTTAGGFVLGLLVALFMQSSAKSPQNSKGGKDVRKQAV